MPKFIRFPFGDPYLAQNRNFFEIQADVYDKAGATIPGLTFHLIWKANALFCNEKYTLFARINERRERIFQIEVYDPRKISHREDGVDWLGPHLYYAGQNRRSSAQFACGEEHRERWLYRFLRHTNTRLVERTPPHQMRIGEMSWR